MTNAELITALRVEPFEVGSFGLARIMNQAADLIEAQQKALDECAKQLADMAAKLEEERNKTVTEIFLEEQLWWEDRCKELEAERTELIAKCRRLEAQLPKEGEWIDDNGANVPLDRDGYTTGMCRCSVCNDWLIASDEYEVRGRYCPNCGARCRQ